MRIFYASGTTPNAAFPSDVWRNNLYLSLVDLGHHVTEFEYELRETFKHLNPENPIDEKFIEKNRPKLSGELLRQIKVAHDIEPIDLFFSYFTDACVLPETIDEISAMGIKTVNWYCNGSYQFHLVAGISPHYDWCLVPEKFRLNDYITIGSRPIYCQEAANPNIYKPYDVPFQFDVTFVGQAYGNRPAFVKYLLDQGIDVRVWGHGWQSFSPAAQVANTPNALTRAAQISRRLLTVQGWQAAVGRFRELAQKLTGSHSAMPGGSYGNIKLPPSVLGQVLSDEEMIKMFSRSKINLGFSTCGNTDKTEERIVQVRLRDFEVPMSGGFYIVEYMEELEEFFEIGKEIVCYTDPEDLVDKIKYYLIHDSEREVIRKAGFERCRRDHSWGKRFEIAFKEMGLDS